MGSEAALQEEAARGERRESAFYAVLPYALLAVCVVITLLVSANGFVVDVPVSLALTAAAAVWLIGSSSLPAAWRTRAAVAGIAYVGLLGLALALTLLAPWYGLFAFLGYVHAFLFLTGWWRYVGVAATSMIMAVSYVGGLYRILDGGWWLWLAIAVVTVLLASASFYFAERNDLHGRRQKHAISELHAANVALEAALEENAALHARLLVAAREAGVLDERQRVARDLHDTLAQSLAGIVAQLEAAEQRLDDRATLRSHLASARDLARESLTEARRTVHAVEPELLVDSRLPDAIGDVARRWSDAAGVAAELAVTGNARPLHPEVEVTLLRTAQEALANVAKHARADRVRLTLSYMEDVVTLDVRDDGVGFPPESPRAAGSGDGGFGLVGMRHRVQRLSGRLDIESEPGAGAAVSATVPAIPAGVAG